MIENSMTLNCQSCHTDASHEVINECGEIEVRTARLIGEFCKGMNGKKGQRTDLTSLHDAGKLKEKTLKELGIDNYWRYEWIADIKAKLFEEYILERKTPDKYINKNVFFQQLLAVIVTEIKGIQIKCPKCKKMNKF